MADTAFCPKPVTCQKHSFQGYEFECGTYSIEDSRKFRARMTRVDDVLNKTVNGRRIFEIIPDVVDKVRMYSEDYTDIAGFKAPQKSGHIHKCRPFEAQKLKRRKVDNRWLYTFPMAMEYALCLKEFIPTWKRNMLRNTGYGNRWKDEGFNAWFINEIMIKSGQRQINNLLINGDYKSPNVKLSQFDGVKKILFQFSRDYIPEVVKLTLPTDFAEGQYLHIAIGGQATSIPFNTDLATTITDIVTWINQNKLQVADEPFYATSTNGNDCIWITEKVQDCGVDVMAFINDNSVFDWYAEENTCGGGAIVEEVQKAKNNHSPIKDDYGRITKDNVYDWITCQLQFLLGYFDRIDGIDEKDIVFFISPELARIIKVGLAHAMKCCEGQSGRIEELLGLNWCVLSQLKGYEYFATWAGNIQFGTDLVSDFSAVDTNYDWDCQTVKFRMEAAAGLNILYPGEVITNIVCMNYNFQPPAEAMQDQYPCCVVDCPDKKDEVCGTCEGGFDYTLYVNEDDSGYFEFKNTGDCENVTSVEYLMTLSDAAAGEVTFSLAATNGQIPFADVSELEGLNINVIQTTQGPIGCPPAQVIKGDTVSVEDDGLEAPIVE